MKFVLSLFLSVFFVFSAFAANVTLSGTEKTLAQNFSATTLDGKSFSLEELRGKVVVMTFWSTRCVICQAETPKFNQMVDKYAGKDVVFLGLTMENESLVSNYLRKKTFKFTIVPNSLGVIMQYADKNPNGSFNIYYPSTFVVNQKGEIELKTSGRKSDTIDATVGKLLANS